jgi:hypothetical protein
MTTTDRKTLALSYLDAITKQDFARLERILTPDLEFRGPSMTRSSAAEFIQALKRICVIHTRSDVRRVFVDGDEVCVIYDFVTDTSAGALPTIEWLRFEGERIRAIDLYYDRMAWQPMMAVVAERVAARAEA